MALRFAGKHCAVVGATGIIGSQIAKAFASQGAVVSLLGRSVLQARPSLESQLPPYRQQPSSAGATTDIPSTHQYIRLDVSDRESIKHIFGSKPSSQTDDAPVVGPVDILVNCAGIAQTTFLKRTPDEELASIIETNLMATMLVCKYAKMRSNGCIINVSSLMANKGSIGATAYVASKAGVVDGKDAHYAALGFTRALCREMASRSIRVNALLPGWVDSPMWDHLKPELKEAYLKDTPANRVADPAEVADAAIFLASNGFANNCVLNLDGGLSAS